MATRKEFQEWLNKFPDDTIIKVGIQESPSQYQSYGPLSFEAINLDSKQYGDGWDYTTMNGVNTLKLGEAF